MNLNFNNFENESPGDVVGRLQGNLSLARQTSIFSLTFDELQGTMGGPGKDFGSMNMDELLKSIWSAEETQTQTTAGSTSGVQEGVGPGGYLQRQGSLTLPRTLSQKTVDEVWRGISKDYGGGVKDGGNFLGGSTMTQPQAQREPTLGEITLEEFLVRAGVVKEDVQSMEKPNNNGLFGNFLQSENISSSGIGLQQTSQNLGLAASRIDDTTNQIAFQSANLQLSVTGSRSSQHQLPTIQRQLLQKPQQQQQQKQHQQHQTQFPKQSTLAYATLMPVQSNGQLGSPGIPSGTLGISELVTNGNLVQNAALQSGELQMVSLGAEAVTVAADSPVVSADGIGKSNGDMSSGSPIPYIFNAGLRGRRCSTVEKVVERRQRRMIKNRESAARSRARKQAYTMELEAEIAKLKEENEILIKKQEAMKMQKNQVSEKDQMRGPKRLCLRRTRTGPW